LKIAFWSNAGEKCSVSANLAAISVASVIRYPYSVLILENHLRSNNLGKAFGGYEPENLFREVGTNYYDGGGIEGLLRKIYRGNYSPDILNSYLKEIINNYLFYIPQSKIIHKELFDYEFDHCFRQLCKLVEEAADISMIDTESQSNLSTKTILEEADLIVVNLCQNQMVLDHFFTYYSSLISKAVFLISNFDHHCALTGRKISDLYQIPLESIILLPNNDFYQNAYSNGAVVEFIYRNYYCLRGTPNYAFMQAVKNAVAIIFRNAEQLIKQKEKECVAIDCGSDHINGSFGFIDVLEPVT
jgi:hypothetical protein